MTYPLSALIAPLWRMLPIRHQRSPLSGEGARLYGGRWNPRGTPAHYLATDAVTAVAEFYQGLPKPGTLAPYQLDASAIADLTDGKAAPADRRIAAALGEPWKAVAARTGGEPIAWALARELIRAGAEGALVPSAQNPGGVNLVLWRWFDPADAPKLAQGGEGAALRLLDPDKALQPYDRN